MYLIKIQGMLRVITDTLGNTSMDVSNNTRFIAGFHSDKPKSAR